MIFFDTETTGLLVPNEPDPAKQPRIVEIAAVKTDAELNEVARMSTLINPGVPIPPEVTKIHGIADAEVAAAPTFARALKECILPFWVGEETVVAYNVEFDLGMLRWELVRLGWEHRFPYCWDVIDAVQYREVNGRRKRLRLEDWSRECIRADAWTPQSHRAMGDVERLLECWRTLK